MKFTKLLLLLFVCLFVFSFLFCFVFCFVLNVNAYGSSINVKRPDFLN